VAEVETPEGWEREGDTFVREFEFDTFDAAMQFMVSAIEPINELNHHPTWTNTYNKVRVELSSHDAGTVTERDVRLAVILDQLASAGEP
jgi:4a-hydroxytetrahydrobiopterin dehydratase